MPPKKQTRGGSGGESKTGLVVTLVFFILATIGLGVSTYFGFADQEALTKAKAEAQKNEGIFKDERDWYKFQATLYRMYLTGNPPKDLKQEEFSPMAKDVVKASKDKNARLPFKGAEVDKTKDDFLTSIVNLDKTMPWDPSADPQPKITVDTILKQKDAMIAALDAASKNATQAQKDAEEKTKNVLAQARKDLDGFNKAKIDLANQAAAEQKTNRDAIADLRKALDERSKDLEQLTLQKAKLQGDLAKLTTELKKSGADLKLVKESEINWRNTAEETKVRLAALAEKAGVDLKILDTAAIDRKQTEALKNWKKDWKIVMMDQRGATPYINLGSADKVVPQLTFSIHSIGLDGKLSLIPKGTAEVIQVVGPNLSRVRITSARDPKADPILKGDMLFNPSWDPTLKKRVVVAGLIDLAGDGRDSSAEFLRTLERQSVVVEGHMDMKDLSMKGKGINIQTDYLIIGDSLDGTADPRSRDSAQVKRMDDTIKKLKSQALDNGVTIIGYRKYLEQIGYRAPRALTDASYPSR